MHGDADQNLACLKARCPHLLSEEHRWTYLDEQVPPCGRLSQRDSTYSPLVPKLSSQLDWLVGCRCCQSDPCQDVGWQVRGWAY